MPDFVLRLVPIDAEFLPERGALAATAQLLKAFLPLAERVQLERGAVLGMWLGCHGMVERGEVQGAVRRQADQSQHAYLSMAGRFARCMVEARNPRVTLLSFEQMKQLEATLGTPLKQVQARYRRSV